jgi:hypothetical protein
VTTKTIIMGGREHEIRPPSRETHRRLLPKLATLQAVATRGVRSWQELDDVLDVVHVVLAAGNEDVDRDWVDDHLAVEKLNDILAAIGAVFLDAAMASPAGKA